MPSVGTKTGHLVQASVGLCQVHWGGNHQRHFDAFKTLTGVDTGKKPVHGGTEIVSSGFFQWNHKISEF